MESTDSNGQTKKGMTSKQKLVIGGAIVGLATIVGLIVYYWRPKPLDTDPPPIIVKSGSFIFETNTNLELTTPPQGGNGPCKDGAGAVNCVYLLRSFNTSLIRVSIFDEKTLRAEPYPYTGPHRVRVFFQNYNPGNGEWGATSATPDVIIEKVDSDLRITLGSQQPLNAQDNRRPRRNWKFQTQSQAVGFRIGKIQIDDQVPIVLESWQDVIIGYN